MSYGDSVKIREEKGKAIFDKGKQIVKKGDIYLVKSSTSRWSDWYEVTEDFNCNCPDSKLNSTTCKHAFAVRYFLQEEEMPNEQRKTYPQNWPAYNKSQEHEKTNFLTLLKELVQNIEEPEYAFGRPRVPTKDLVFASALKVYTQFSLRRFKSDLKDAHDKQLVTTEPCFASVGHFMQRKDLTATLHELIKTTAEPLKDLEKTIAVDSSGFRTTQFNDYCREKHNIKQEHQWLKAHISCGTKTNIITAVEITDSNANDAPYFKTLVNQTAAYYRPEEVLADKGYLSKENYQVVRGIGSQAFIPFKSNNSGKSNGSGSLFWRKMWLYYQLHQQEFLEHYHKRSNVESTFYMIKSKFNDKIRNKTKTAQVNELLLKILCHNIVVIIHEMNELKINTEFDKIS